MPASVDIDSTPPTSSVLSPLDARWLHENLERIRQIIAVLDAGQTKNGTFTVSGTTYTVTNGIITNIV